MAAGYLDDLRKFRRSLDTGRIRKLPYRDVIESKELKEKLLIVCTYYPDLVWRPVPKTLVVQPDVQQHCRRPAELPAAPVRLPDILIL